MTVAVRPSTTSYIEDGTTNVYPLPFRYAAPGDIAAGRLLADGSAVPLINGTDFTVSSGDSDAGGAATVATPGAAGTQITFVRLTAQAQQAQYPTNDRFPAKLTEQSLDLLMLICQEQQDQIQRSPKVPVGQAARALAGLYPVVTVGGGFDFAAGPAPITRYGKWTPQRTFVPAIAAPPTWSRLDLSLFDTVIGDGIADDTAAMQQIVAKVNASTRGGAIHFGTKMPRIRGDLAFTKPVALLGEIGAGSRIVCASNARILLNGGVRSEYNGAMMLIERIGIETEGIHANSPLRVSYDDGGTSLLGSLIMRDSYVAGRDATSGFVHGVELNNVGFQNFHEVRIMGNRSGPVPAASRCLVITGDGGSGQFKGLRCYFAKRLVDIYANTEGHIFDGCEMIAGVEGIIAADSTGGFQPYIVVANTHVNVEQTSIKLAGYTEFDIGRGCDLYGQGFDGSGSGTWTAIDIDPGPYSYVMNGNVDVSMVQGDARYATYATGVRLRAGAAGGQQQVRIKGAYQSLTTAVQLDAGTFGARVSRDSIYTNCGTAVSNFGTNIVDMVGPASPEGVVASSPGGLYSSYTDGKLYSKQSGTGLTGWVAQA